MAAVCKINCTKLGKGNHVYRVVNQRNVETHTRALSRRAERRRSSDVGRIEGCVAPYIGDMIENRRLRFVNTILDTPHLRCLSFPVFVVIRFVFVVFFSFS